MDASLDIDIYTENPILEKHMKAYTKYTLMIVLLALAYTSTANDTDKNTKKSFTKKDVIAVGEIAFHGLLTGINLSFLNTTIQEDAPIESQLILVGTSMLTGAFTTAKCIKYIRQLKQ